MAEAGAKGKGKQGEQRTVMTDEERLEGDVEIPLTLKRFERAEQELLRLCG
jgi:hypothetical protein